MLDWLQDHHTVLWAFIGISVVTLLASLFLVPLMIVRIPANYFDQTAEHRQPVADRHPVAHVLIVIGKNLLGLVLIVLGFLMLVLPGQGVLTILAGLVLVDFPGRQRAIQWIVSRHAVLKSMNWIRERGGKEPLIVSSPRVAGAAHGGER